MRAEDTDRHWQLYDLALQEVRAQVDRGWAYAQFFILLGAATTGALLAYAGAGGSRWVVAAGLVAGGVVALIGIMVLRESKRYYRTLAAKRAAIEVRLGLDQNIAGSTDPLTIYALTATADARKLRTMAADASAYVR